MSRSSDIHCRLNERSESRVKRFRGHGSNAFPIHPPWGDRNRDGSSVSSKARANRGFSFKRLWFPLMYAHMELGGKQADGLSFSVPVGEVPASTWIVARPNQIDVTVTNRSLKTIHVGDCGLFSSTRRSSNFDAPRMSRPGRSSHQWIWVQQGFDRCSLVCFGIPGR